MSGKGKMGDGGQKLHTSSYKISSGDVIHSVVTTVNNSVQSLHCVRLFATPWTAARQASLSIINSQSFAQTHVH